MTRWGCKISLDHIFIVNTTYDSSVVQYDNTYNTLVRPQAVVLPSYAGSNVVMAVGSISPELLAASNFAKSIEILKEKIFCGMSVSFTNLT